MPSQPHQPEQRSSISVLTLVIASASSVVAAVVVSRIWGPGTLVGAAATPVIVTLVSEALKKPAEVITVVRAPVGTGPQAAGRPRPRQEVAPEDLHAGDTVVAAPPPASRARRPALIAALVTGLVAFVIGAFVLTGGELVFGDSAVGSGGGRTTILGGKAKTRTTTTTETRSTPAPTTSTETQTTTTTVPATPTTPPDETTSTETTPAVPPAGGATGATGATG